VVTTTLTAPTVLGLDLSLARTGVAGNAGGGWTDTLRPPTKLAGHRRLAWIEDQILDRFATAVDLVVVEGPSYGSQAGPVRQSGHHERAGLWWLVTHALWARETQVVVMPPASLKRYATGRGNAGKDDVLREVTKRFAWFTGDNNEADALILAAAGGDWAGTPMVTMPAAHRAAIAALGWPALELAAAP
jgi:Holliday junction resolvasome RuvABC endonuclease subunit